MLTIITSLTAIYERTNILVSIRPHFKSNLTYKNMSYVNNSNAILIFNRCLIQIKTLGGRSLFMTLWLKHYFVRLNDLISSHLEFKHKEIQFLIINKYKVSFYEKRFTKLIWLVTATKRIKESR